MNHVDWKRRRCVVEPTDLPGKAKWSGSGGGLSFELTQGMRDVLLGADPAGVRVSRRGAAALSELRAHHGGDVADGATVLRRSPGGELHWWTWAGAAANRTLRASLGGLVDPAQRSDDRVLRLRGGDDPRRAATMLGEQAEMDLVEPVVNDHAVAGLKFSAALPPEMARSTVATRLGDEEGAAAVLAQPRTVGVH